MKNMNEEDSNYSAITDEELIRKIRNGDNEVWEKLYKNNEVYIEKIARNKVKKINYGLTQKGDELILELCQAGWSGFVDAIRHYDSAKKKNSKFKTYAASWIDGEMSKALDNYLNRTGATGRVKYHQMIQSVEFDSLDEEQRALLLYANSPKDSEDHDQLVEELKEKLHCTDKGSYTETARVLQLLKLLKMMTDEKHTLSKSQLYGMLELYRLAKDKNSTKLEGDNTLGPAVQKLLQEVDPLEYTQTNDKEYLIKYKDYKNNVVLQNMELDGSRKKGQKKATITDLYYEHPFSYAELDQLIALVAFSDMILEDDKIYLIEKLKATSSVYYNTPFVNDYKKKIEYKEKRIADRFTNNVRSLRNNIPQNLKVLQEAINRLVQVQFRLCGYDEKGMLDTNKGYVHKVSPYHIVVYHDQYYLIGLKENSKNVWHFRIDLMNDVELLRDDKGRYVPIEIKQKDILPLGIRDDEWNPERYLSEHLYMAYDRPKDIQIKIKNTNYTILHDWFGNHYRKLHRKCEEGYDVVEVKTSPAMIVHWAMQYSSYVEILNEDVRKMIREEIEKMNEKYGV